MTRAARPRDGGTHRARTDGAARNLVAETRPPTRAAAPTPRPAAAPKVSRHDAVADRMPGQYEFAPRRATRRLLTLAVLAGLVVSAALARTAIESEDNQSIGLAAIALLATALVWAIRAGAAVTRLTVRQGQLEVLRQGQRQVFDLAGDYTFLEVHGRPGRRGWKVVFPRASQGPLVIDASIVDPDDFMRVLRFFKPGLVEQA